MSWNVLSDGLMAATNTTEAIRLLGEGISRRNARKSGATFSDEQYADAVWRLVPWAAYAK